MRVEDSLSVYLRLCLLSMYVKAANTTNKSVSTSKVSIPTSFLFPERTTIRLSLSRSDLIRFSIAYHRLFYYLFDIQIPSRDSSTRGDSFLSNKVVCNLIIIVFCHAEYITHTIVHMFPSSWKVKILICK